MVNLEDQKPKLYGANSLVTDIKNIGSIDIIEKSASDKIDGDMIFSGWASTGAIDLTNEIVEPSSFKKHFYRYENNPIYLWQHKKDVPIGKVGTPKLSDKGVYFENVRLSDIPLNREMIWPMIKDGTLQQQSIGFKGLDAEYDKEKGVWRFTESYLLEGSIVSIAANPEAEVDLVKYLNFDPDKYRTVDDLFESIFKNAEILEQKIKTMYFMGNTNNISGTNEDKQNVNDTWSVNDKNEDGLYTHLLIKDSKKSLPLSSENGEYDKSKIAFAVFSVYGTKDFNIDIEDKQKALVSKTLSDIYSNLEMTEPVFEANGEQKSLFKNFSDYEGQNIYFKENENLYFSNVLISNKVKELEDGVKFLNKSNFLLNDTLDRIKYLYSWLKVEVSIHDEEDAKAAKRIIDAVVDIEEEAQESLNSAYDVENSTDAEKQKEESVEETKQEAKEEANEETKEDSNEDEDDLEEIVKLLEELNKE